MRNLGWFSCRGQQACIVSSLVAFTLCSCAGPAYREVEFSSNDKLVAYEKTYVWNPLWPLWVFEASHDVCWRPVEGGSASERGVRIGRSGNIFGPAADQSITSLAFSPDSRHLAVVRADGQIIIADLGSGKSWNLNQPRTRNVKLVWGSDEDIICREEVEFVSSSLADPVLSITWQQNIHRPSYSRVPATMPAETPVPESQAELLTQLHRSTPESKINSSPDYFLSRDGKLLATVKHHLLISTLSVSPAPTTQPSVK